MASVFQDWRPRRVAKRYTRMPPTGTGRLRRRARRRHHPARAEQAACAVPDGQARRIEPHALGKLVSDLLGVPERPVRDNWRTGRLQACMIGKHLR
jgi:hypothetical protein